MLALTKRAFFPLARNLCFYTRYTRRKTSQLCQVTGICSKKFRLPLTSPRPICDSPDFTIPKLFSVKGKIGAYVDQYRMRMHATLKNTGSRGHWWWVRHWHDDCHCVRTERRQGLHRVSQGEAAQGGARTATLISDTVYAFQPLTSAPKPGIRKVESNLPWVLRICRG